MLTLAGGLAIGTLVSAQVVGRTGVHRPFPVVGAVIAGGCARRLALLGPEPAAATVGVCLALLGLGIGCAWEVLVIMVQNAVDTSRVGAATAMNGFTREIGVLLGSAYAGGMITTRLSDGASAGSAFGPVFATSGDRGAGRGSGAAGRAAAAAVHRPPGCRPRAGGAMRFSVVVPAYNEAASLPGRDGLAAPTGCRRGPASRSSWWTTAVTTTRRRSPGRTARGSWSSRAAASVTPGRPGSTRRGASSWSPPTPTPRTRGDWLRRMDAGLRRARTRWRSADRAATRIRPWWAGVFPMIGFGLVGAVTRLRGATLLPHRDERGVPARGIPRLHTRLTQGGD